MALVEPYTSLPILQRLCIPHAEMVFSKHMTRARRENSNFVPHSAGTQEGTYEYVKSSAASLPRLVERALQYNVCGHVVWR